MKHILKTISFIFCITLFIFVCSCTESVPSTNKYTVTFKDYDGTILREEVIQEGHNATSPTDPERYGYIFVGWDGEYINIQKDTILIAQYKKDESIVFEYTVTFVDYNGTLIKEEQVEEGHNATAPSDPEREGYKFIGWDKDYSNVTSNLTVIAQYELIKQEETVKKYTVTFVTNSETIIESQEVEEGHKINKPEIPNKKGYSFVGWYIDEEEWNFDRFSVFEDTTLVAKYEIAVYTIEYDLNDGSLGEENPATYTYFDSFVLNNPTKEHYEFLGWTTYEMTEPVLDLKVEGEVGNKVYKANYIPKQYKLNLNLNGGTISNENTNEFNYEELLSLEPQKEGYTFIGWFVNTTMNNLIDVIDNFKLDEVTVNAWWVNDEYEYIVENNYMYIYMGRYPQSLVNDELTINALSNITTTNEFGYIEYKGNEYQKNIATKDIYIKDILIEQGTINYFLVEPIKWKVIDVNNERYKLISENILDISKYYASYETRTINGQTIHPSNYEYSDIRAWLNGYNGTYYNVSDYTDKGFVNIAFNEKEQKNIEKTLIDNSIKSTGVEENRYLCNDTKDKVYILSDYELNTSLYGFADETMRQSKVSDYALYLGVNYFSSFNAGCWWGRTPSSRSHDKGREVTYVSWGGSIYPTDVNYPTFSETGVKPVIEILLNQTQENIVTFRDHDGIILKEEYVENGKDATPPANPLKVGYDFIGWSKTCTEIENDIEIYAVYKIIEYTITFDVDGGYTVDNIQFTIETDDFMLPITYKEGYKFLGWYENDILIEQIENRNYNLIAKWEKQETYTVTFNTDGGVLNNIEYFADEFVEDFCFYSKESIDKINFKVTTPSAIKNFFNKGEILSKYKWLLEFLLSEFENIAIERNLVNNSYYLSVVELLGKMIDGDVTAITGDYADARTILRWLLEGLLNAKLTVTDYSGYDLFMIDYSSIENLIRFESLYQLQVNSYNISKENVLVDCYKKGYKFLGWYNGDVKVEQISENVSLTAKWEIIVYSVVFDEDGGTVINSIEYTIEDETIDLTREEYIPVKEGYKFLGWYNDGEKVEVLEQDACENYILVAKWGELIKEGLMIYEENGCKYIEFGRFPQTVVTDELIIDALNGINTTNSLGYIEYDGNEYKKIRAYTYEMDYKFINGDNIEETNMYYFLVEPIKWRVLEENDGTYKLISEMILDNTNFYHIYNQNRTINGQTIYPNNYEYSNIRAWLNGYNGTSYNVEDYTNKGFYDIAFTDEDKLLINATLVDNSLSSTGDSINSYICNNTIDKIYLLSVEEVLKKEYWGDSIKSGFRNIELQAQTTDYARSKNTNISTSNEFYGNGFWWLRSPEDYDERVANCIKPLGVMYWSYEGFGVRPALTITIE